MIKEAYVRKIQKTSTHSYVVNIPKELMTLFKWREKQKLEILFKGRKGEMVIRNVKKTKKKK